MLHDVDRKRVVETLIFDQRLRRELEQRGHAICGTRMSQHNLTERREVRKTLARRLQRRHIEALPLQLAAQQQRTRTHFENPRMWTELLDVLVNVAPAKRRL